MDYRLDDYRFLILLIISSPWDCENEEGKAANGENTSKVIDTG